MADVPTLDMEPDEGAGPSCMDLHTMEAGERSAPEPADQAAEDARAAKRAEHAAQLVKWADEWPEREAMIAKDGTVVDNHPEVKTRLKFWCENGGRHFLLTDEFGHGRQSFDNTWFAIWMTPEGVNELTLFGIDAALLVNFDTEPPSWFMPYLRTMENNFLKQNEALRLEKEAHQATKQVWRHYARTLDNWPGRLSNSLSPVCLAHLRFRFRAPLSSREE